MSRLFVALLLPFTVVALIPCASGEEPPDAPPAPDPIPLVRLAASAKPPTPALKYQLYPDQLDLTPGNAATVWMRAGRAAAGVKPRVTEKESKWLNPKDAPLGAFPKKDVRDFLAHYANTLRLADEAARKNHCDWELPPLTLQGLMTYSLDDVQLCREIANLLSIQCRLQLSDGNFDGAIHTLQTGFALARHAGNGDTLIQNLVGIAIASVMLARVEEMMQIPDAPNLYWALTTLPSPFIDMRTTMNMEMNTIHRSFPQLRKLDSQEMAAAEFEKAASEMFQELAKQSGQPFGGIEGKLTLTALVLKSYPDAKQHLIAGGRTEEKVAAMPALQVVLIDNLDQYNSIRDEILAAASLPSWQARPALAQVDKKMRTMRADGVLNPFIYLLMPAITKVYDADLRLQRSLAMYRTAESFRWYASTHDGKVPERLSDVTDVPGVVDPLTGKGFDALYQMRDFTAILKVPAMSHQPVQLGRRFELKGMR